MSYKKVVICGAGFLGRHIAKAVATSANLKNEPAPRVQISSRNPLKIWDVLQLDRDITKDRLLPAMPVDITKQSTIRTAFKDANVVVSLVGIVHGSPKDFEMVQWKGAENIAIGARDAGAKLIHFSAIGANPESHIPYSRTKGLAEQSILAIQPSATIIRPSLVFGPEDDFFNRFARVSKILPFLPVFGGGRTLFQPVYVGDLAQLVCHICTSNSDTGIGRQLEGKIIEAGGPQIFNYRELMQLILDTTGRSRAVISLPFVVGMLQGAILERLPVNLFTVTRSQVEQLQKNNIVDQQMLPNHVSLEEIVSKFGLQPLHTVRDVLPTYLC